MLELFAILGAVSFSALVVMQLAIPGWRGRPLFPMLRPSDRKVRRLKAEAADELALAEAEHQAALLRVQVLRTKRETEREELNEFDEQLKEAKRKH